MHHYYYLLLDWFHQRINIYLTFIGMKSNSSNFNWKRLMEILLVLSIVGLLIFVFEFIL